MEDQKKYFINISLMNKLLIVFNNSKLIGQDFNLLKNYIFKTTSLKYYENKDIEGDICISSIKSV